MSKWNKQAQPLSQEFLDNQQRRKQMIIQAARRRREKEKKLVEQEEKERKDEEEALHKHKQEKKDAYIKYLRSNMHDKYEDLKRRKKEETNEIKPMSKWKKKSAQKDSKLEALDLEVNVDLSPPKAAETRPTKVGHQRQQLAEQFEKEWQMEIDCKDELLSSKLLDSLDLDGATIARQFEVKNLQIQQNNKDEVKQLRDLIGYESTVFNNQINKKPQQEILPQERKDAGVKNQKGKGEVKPEVSEVQLLNELKRKKEAKIMHWAIEEQQEAQDLFSNCSSRKKESKATRQGSQEKKCQPLKKTPILSTISEEVKSLNNKPLPIRQSVNSQILETEKQKIPLNYNRQSQEDRATTSHTAFTKKDNPQSQQSTSNEKKPAKTATGFNSDKNMTRIRTTSLDKPKANSRDSEQRANSKEKAKATSSGFTKPPKVVEPARKMFGNFPPLPASKSECNNSIATHDINIDVQSFIRQDLINLNEQEWKLQQELRTFHKQHRDNIKEVFAKHQIKTDFQNSAEIMGKTETIPKKAGQNEQNIEQSIMNLNNLLIRREIIAKNAQQAIKEETQENTSASFINPFSSSNDLCNQVLQLARNVSRFQRPAQEQQQGGYAQMSKHKKGSSANKESRHSAEKGSVVSKWKPQQQELCESQQVSEVYGLERPPLILDFDIGNRLRQSGHQKIHVNTNLLKGLLLDDD